MYDSEKNTQMFDWYKSQYENSLKLANMSRTNGDTVTALFYESEACNYKIMMERIEG